MKLYASVVLAGLGACVAQLAMPPLSGRCDWASLPAKMQALDAVCCFQSETGDQGAACVDSTRSICNVDCAALLLPLLETCHALIDILFDASDGFEDGIAGQFDIVYESCLQIDQAEAMAVLAEMQARGDCTEDDLNGVGETHVDAAPCVDARAGCDHMISSGFMTCAADFSASGPMAGQCDLSCSFCVASGPPRGCSDKRAGCQATIDSGFVSCATDFCEQCPMAGDCGASVLWLLLCETVGTLRR